MLTKNTWQDSEYLECVSVIPEVANTVSFLFRSPSGALFDYLPGQFLSLQIPVGNQPVYRTYTISSSPSRPNIITITAKAQPDSIGTRWMIDHLKPGMRIKAIGPAGDFTYAQNADRKFLFISAGSGITPMMSMTTCLTDEGRDPDIVFINFAKYPSEIIFRHRLEYLASRSTRLNLKFVVQEPDPFSAWTGYQGFFNRKMLELITPDLLQRDVFCCGPEPFMRAVKEGLGELGFDFSRYYQESFQPPEATTENQAKQDVATKASAQAKILFVASDISAACSETDTVLQVAKSSGLNIPSGCTFGICGTCKVKKLSGEVNMNHSGGISDEDISEGYILACCSRPLGEVSVDV